MYTHHSPPHTRAPSHAGQERPIPPLKHIKDWSTARYSANSDKGLQKLDDGHLGVVCRAAEGGRHQSVMKCPALHNIC